MAGKSPAGPARPERPLLESAITAGHANSPPFPALPPSLPACTLPLRWPLLAEVERPRMEGRLYRPAEPRGGMPTPRTAGAPLRSARKLRAEPEPWQAREAGIHAKFCMNPLLRIVLL